MALKNNFKEAMVNMVMILGLLYSHSYEQITCFIVFVYHYHESYEF